MIQLSENSLTILRDRYLLRDANGHTVETPDALFRRVAKAVAGAEAQWGDYNKVILWEEKFYSVLSQLLFLPNSPTLMNAGMPSGQLSACFVLPVVDPLHDIFSTLSQVALIQQSGGGTGFNFSQIRPRNDRLKENNGTAYGPVSFMKLFNAVTEYIKQGGKRRGANMGILNIDHPDIYEFIGAKKETGVLSNFNLSVGITDDFMHAVKNNLFWSLIHPVTKKEVCKIQAQELWEKIADAAWHTGDPGLVFLDTINAVNPTPALGKILSTNPCGEIPLLPYEPCNLGSINVSKMIHYPNGKAVINWVLLEEVVQTAVRFLDDVIEVNHYITPEIKNMALGNRKTGLGVMGWAELLVLLEIPYDTVQAVTLAGQLMQFISQKSMQASVQLAAERGVFINWEKSIYYPQYPVRNATRTAIAPTGTISMIADTSSSIEPFFALAFERRNVLSGKTLFSCNPLFIRYLKQKGLYTESIMDQLMKEGVSGNISLLPEAVKKLFATALEISPEWHIRHQEAFQKFTDNAVAKTINLPEQTTPEQIAGLFTTAWDLKLKGITVFRFNNRNNRVIYPGHTFTGNNCHICRE